MRLIDANELKRKILFERDKIPSSIPGASYEFGIEKPNHHGNSMRGGIRKALRCMEQCKTIDAVEVVRCKDCKHWRREAGWCTIHSNFVDSYGMACHPWESADWKMLEENDFCSYGERRTNETN